MRLSRMDDVAGCRLIFPDIESLHEFRQEFHTARFRHKLKNNKDRYDYIARPKASGYRGIHDVYSYDVRSKLGADLRGLLIEIQYRTLVQHAWATAVEVVGFITEHQPKFDQGDEKILLVMAHASEILARSAESRHGPLPGLNDRSLVRNFLSLEKKTGLLQMLAGISAAESANVRNKNTILIFPESGDLEILTFEYATEALRKLFELEKTELQSDIVLVRADSSEEIRLAFKNYFSDAVDFVRLVEEGCEKLSGSGMIVRNRRKKAANKKS